MKTVAVFAFALLIATTAAVDGDVWAILVGGSDGWYNYRHQSDVSHAYQLLIENGVSPDHIINFHKDDIANNPSNPTPGIVINQPDGKDVYHDIAIDYSGEDCTAANLLAVIRGDADAVAGIGSGRVLASSAAKGDRVFINYSDHGSVGLVAMPVGPYLYSDQLDEALTQAYEAGLYDECLFYLEACESGSMFSETLADDDARPIFATTAANPSQSSYAYYYDDARGTYLGDEYSISWMESADEWDLCTATVDEHFAYYKDRTEGSEVCKYGNYDNFKGYTLKRFLGDINTCDGASATLSAPSVAPRGDNSFTAPAEVSRVSSRDVKLATIQRNLAANDISHMDRIRLTAALKTEEAHREYSDNLFASLAALLVEEEHVHAVLNERMPLDEFVCTRTAVEALESSCGRLSDYSIQYTRVLSNACEMDVPIAHILRSIETVC